MVVSRAPAMTPSMIPFSVLHQQTVIRDDAANRTVVMLVIGLVVLGVALLAITFWFWRTSRPEHPALGPLEVMGSERFWRRDAVEQLELLDSARPAGAEPERSVAHALLPHGPRPTPQDLDAQLAELGVPLSFDDLQDPIDDDAASELLDGPDRHE